MARDRLDIPIRYNYVNAKDKERYEIVVSGHDFFPLIIERYFPVAT